MKTVEDHRNEYFHVRRSGFWGAVIAALVILGFAAAGTYWKTAQKARDLIAERIPDKFVSDFLVHADRAEAITVSAFPVGSIIAWHQDMPGTPPLPEGGPWARCDGQVLDNLAYEGTPYFGKNLPPLNSAKDPRPNK